MNSESLPRIIEKVLLKEPNAQRNEKCKLVEQVGKLGRRKGTLSTSRTKSLKMHSTLKTSHMFADIFC